MQIKCTSSSVVLEFTLIIFTTSVTNVRLAGCTNSVQHLYMSTSSHDTRIYIVHSFRVVLHVSIPDCPSLDISKQ